MMGSYIRQRIVVATTKIVDNGGANLQSEDSDISGPITGEIMVSPTPPQQRRRGKEGNGGRRKGKDRDLHQFKKNWERTDI